MSRHVWSPSGELLYTKAPAENEAEAATARQLDRFGVCWSKNGWPDFLCVTPDGRFFCIEVKGPGQPVKENQAQVIDLLSHCGLRTVILWGGNSTLAHLRSMGLSPRKDYRSNRLGAPADMRPSKWWRD